MATLCCNTDLKTPVFSVHPKLGNPIVRNDLNRLIMPRPDDATPVSQQVGQVKIMWSSTRLDMNAKNWMANHFVVAVEQNICSDESQQNGTSLQLPSNPSKREISLSTDCYENQEHGTFFICQENEIADMIQCQVCLSLVHVLCANTDGL